MTLSIHNHFDGRINLFHGDCLEILDSLPDNSVDSCVCDPPYHLVSIVKRFGGKDAAACITPEGGTGAYARASKGFMQKTWDGGDIAFRADTWAKVYRVLKPGGHIVAFSGTRTVHRMVCAIEDAGFEIRDMLAWLYGTGFPKSHNVSKGIDKAAGAVREVVGEKKKLQSYGANEIYGDGPDKGGVMEITAPATPAAIEWQGWGTALKPALEPICLARKPLGEKTVAANVLAWGTGALNIDGTRVPTDDKLGGGGEKAETAGQFTNDGWQRPWMDDPAASEAFAAKVRANVAKAEGLGRWPANVITDGSEEVVGMFPQAKGAVSNGKKKGNGYGENYGGMEQVSSYADSGSAARFFYSAKANKRDRAESKHPTVKPVALMRWLCRLVTPPGGTLVDPFAGSGTTGEAAYLEGFKAILIEREEEYVADITRRLSAIEPANDNLKEAA